MLINVMLIKKYVNIKSKNLTHFEFSRLATMLTRLDLIRVDDGGTANNGREVAWNPGFKQNRGK